MTHRPPDNRGTAADGLHEQYGPEASDAVAAEARLPDAGWQREVARGLEFGLPAADSVIDRRIPTFSRGELPHFAGINTFLNAPFVEDVRTCCDYDVAVLGAPYEVVECSPPYDNAEITALIATRVICDTLGCLVRAGHLPANPAKEPMS